MAEISQAMIGALQEAMAQLTAAVSSQAATIATLMANKADRPDVENLFARIDSMQTDITAISVAVKPVVDAKVG